MKLTDLQTSKAIALALKRDLTVRDQRHLIGYYFASISGAPFKPLSPDIHRQTKESVTLSVLSDAVFHFQEIQEKRDRELNNIREI